MGTGGKALPGRGGSLEGGHLWHPIEWGGCQGLAGRQQVPGCSKVLPSGVAGPSCVRGRLPITHWTMVHAARLARPGAARPGQGAWHS